MQLNYITRAPRALYETKSSARAATHARKRCRKKRFNSSIAINRKRSACFSRAVFHYSSAAERCPRITRENRAVFHARPIRIASSNLWKSAHRLRDCVNASPIRFAGHARMPTYAAEIMGRRNATCYARRSSAFRGLAQSRGRSRLVP